MPKIGSPNQTCKFWDILANISGPGAYFSNRFLRWNRELKPVVLSTMNPINGTNFFLSYKGGGSFLKSRTPQLKPLKIENFNDFPKTYIIYPNNYYQPNCKCDFFNFQPALWSMGALRPEGNGQNHCWEGFWPSLPHLSWSLWKGFLSHLCSWTNEKLILFLYH